MERTLDYKGRWRNHTVAFRVSDEEAKLLNDLVALSGLTKQDYITRRLLCRDVVVQGKTDCLLVRGDFNTFFSDSSITQYFGSPSGNGF